MNLDESTGQLSGVPPALGEYDFTVEVISADDQSAERNLSIGVFAPLEITTASLPSVTRGSSYEATLTASGGDGDHTWSVAVGTLPEGLSLDASTGGIAGTPSMTGSSDLTFEVASGDGQTATIDLVIAVHGVLTVETSSLPFGIQGVEYGETATASGGDGSFTWSLITGTLPSGLTLGETSGEISGTPTTVEEQTFMIEVASGDGQSAQADLSLAIHPLLEISTSALPVGTQEIAYNDTLEASGGIGAHVWTVVSGSLPAGLTLAPGTGEISGTPSLVQDTDFTVRVTSDDGQAAEAALSLVVEPQILSPSELCTDYPAQSLVAFEDPDLDSEIRSELGIGPQSDLTCEMVGGMTHFFADQAGIISLVGIQNLVGLTRLGLGQNYIADLTPLQGLDNLEELLLHANAISDVSPLGGLTNLDLLWLGENSITDITPLGGLTGLTRLLLLDNSITDVAPLSSLTQLTHLRLDNNPIGDLSTVGGLTSLERLDLGELSITDISFLSGLTNLVSLSLFQNQVADLSPLSGLTQLTNLNVSHNAVSDAAPIGSLTNLETLFLPGNVLSDLGPLAGLTTLTWVSLSGNEIVDVSALQGLTALEQLYLDQNPSLADIQPLLDNVGLASGDQVNVQQTSVACVDVTALEAKGVTVSSDCP